MSHKNMDKKNRWRNKTVAFRMSPAESKELDKRVRLSGLTKQDYIISRLSEKTIIVQGSPRVYKALRNEMTAILTELQRLQCCSEADDEFISLLRLVVETANGMKEESQ